MFGYVLINKAELKCREFEEYGGIYCGLCMALKESHGNISRFCVNYDLTFLSILLADLYDEKVQIYKKRCISTSSNPLIFLLIHLMVHHQRNLILIQT